MKMRKSGAWWMVVGAALAVLAVGCSDDESKGGGGGRCTAETRDTSALADELRCVRDDDCACGGYCDLGVCAYDCAADADCGGSERCDLHGRCRPASDPSNVSPPLAEPAAPVQLATPGALLQDSAQRVDFVVTDRPLPRARWVAEAGAQVSCDGADGSFGKTCVLTDLEPGAHTVWVRRPPAPAAAMSMKAWLSGRFAPDTHDDASAKSDPALSLHTATRTSSVSLLPEAAALAPTEGVYRGLATLSAAGSSTALGEALGVVGNVGLLLDAEVHPDGTDAYLVAISDPVGLLGGGSEWVLRLSKDSSGAWTAEAPPLPYLRSNGAELAASPVWKRVSVTGAINLAFDMHLMGALAGATPREEGALLGRWELSLSRRGDLAESASKPALQTGATVPIAAQVAGKALPWEDAARGALASVWTAASAGANVASLTPTPALWQCESGQSPYKLVCESLWTAAGGTANCTTYEAEIEQGKVICETNSCGGTRRLPANCRDSSFRPPRPQATTMPSPSYCMTRPGCPSTSSIAAACHTLTRTSPAATKKAPGAGLYARTRRCNSSAGFDQSSSASCLLIFAA